MKTKILLLAAFACLMSFGTVQAKSYDLIGKMMYPSFPGISKLYHPKMASQPKLKSLSFPGISTLYPEAQKKASSQDLENIYLVVTDNSFGYDYTIQIGYLTVTTDVSMFTDNVCLLGQLPDGEYGMLFTNNDGIACQGDFYDVSGYGDGVTYSADYSQGRVDGIIVDGPSTAYNGYGDDEVDVYPFD
jgi:hypothetical protein